MNKSLVITSVISIILTVLLILSVFIFAIFPVTVNNSYGYEFLIEFNNIELYKFYSAMGGPFYQIEPFYMNDKMCLGIVCTPYLFENDVYTFQIGNPNVFLVYDISYLGFSSLSEFDQWFFPYEPDPPRIISLTPERFVYGCLLPVNWLPYYEEESDNPTGTIIYPMIDYYNTNGSFPYLYEINSTNEIMQVVHDETGGIYMNIFPLPLPAKYAFHVDLSTYNVFSSALSSFNDTVKYLEFPRFNFKYDSLLDLPQLFKNVFNYIGDVIYYVKTVISSFFYSITPFFWLS